MKKYFALIITLLVVLTCFTSCKAKLKGGQYINTAAGGEGYAAVTKADGGVVRDDAGNLIVLVTDENGKNVKGDDGEYQTNRVALEYALVVGNRIECPTYAINIPNGWEDSISFNDLVIKKSGTKDFLRIATHGDTSIDKLAEQAKTGLIDAAIAQYPDAVYETKGIKISDAIPSAQFQSLLVPDNGTGAASYMGYIYFEHKGNAYACSITSDRDLSGSIDEFTKILSTIEFI